MTESLSQPGVPATVNGKREEYRLRPPAQKNEVLANVIDVQFEVGFRDACAILRMNMFFSVIYSNLN